MRLAELDTGAAEIVAVVGDVDAPNAPQLSRALDHALDRHDARLVVDLTDTSFLHADGVAALRAADDVAGQKGCRLSVVVPDDSHFHPILADVGLPTAPSRAHALRQ